MLLPTAAFFLIVQLNFLAMFFALEKVRKRTEKDITE